MHTTFLVLATAALIFQTLVLILAFFGPELPYRIRQPLDMPLDSHRFQSLMEVLTDAQLYCENDLTVLTNGDQFYRAELDAIRAAKHSINLEAYIFQKGDIAGQFVSAMTERAKAGVDVKLIIDYIGSFSTFRSYFRDLLAAGGQVEWYHSFRPDLLPHLNNRTHRELMIVDGVTGFIGGAGIADQWYHGLGNKPRWRDTVICAKGPVVSGLQSVFAENWLRVSGEILCSSEYFQFPEGTGRSIGLVVNSTPAGGSTRSRILFQTLIAAAKDKIYISTPYFLPDRSARGAIIEAVRDRGVQVKILTPGKKSDHALTRNSSRLHYGQLLKHGIDIHEYEAAMIHVKAMMVDDQWAVVGSTNFDNRSFAINDEVNLAILDAAVTKRLVEDFERDLASSKQITYEDWQRKSRFQFYEHLQGLLEKQE
jgi:cardiolipin synthase A/B